MHVLYCGDCRARSNRKHAIVRVLRTEDHVADVDRQLCANLQRKSGCAQAFRTLSGAGNTEGPTPSASAHKQCSCLRPPIAGCAHVFTAMSFAEKPVKNSHRKQRFFHVFLSPALFFFFFSRPLMFSYTYRLPLLSPFVSTFCFQRHSRC